jgi:N-acetylglucosaminyldiphosphoundecaprenol N-acetyl-beta-D-mannosaminyltransferase
MGAGLLSAPASNCDWVVEFLCQVRRMSNESGVTVGLFGLPVSNLTMSEAVARIAEWIESGTMHQIVTANLDFARNARKNEFLHRVICGSSMVLPDGAPLLWASRLLRKPLKERVTGVDLVPELARLSAERGYGIFLLGSSDENAKTAAEALQRMHPGVRFVGSYSPPVASLDKMDDTEILRRIAAANPDILLVAFGNPKQEVWISRNFHQLHVPVAIGIGGSLDMIAGSMKRAPRWIQKLNMEWCFRMLQEPQRLLPRYAHDFMALLKHLPAEIMANRMQPGRAAESGVAPELEGDNRLVWTPKVLTGEACASLIASAHAAARQKQMLILDMGLTTRIEADGIGCLIEARRIMMVAHESVWLTCVAQPVRRMLSATALLEMFRTAMTPVDAIRLSKSGLPHPERRKRPRLVSGARRTQRAELVNSQLLVSLPGSSPCLKRETCGAGRKCTRSG